MMAMEPQPADHRLLKLAEDVRLIPVKDLSSETRARLGAAPEDVVVSQPMSRRTSRLIDAEAAALVALFLEPRSVLDAVVTFSESFGRDPENVLDDASRLLHNLFEDGLLREATAELSVVRTVPAAQPAHERIIHSTDDTIVELVSWVGAGTAVRKSVLPTARGWVKRSLLREADVLRVLDGTLAPRLLAQSANEDDLSLTMEHVVGAPVSDLAGPTRTPDLRGRLSIASTVLGAYADLHDLGVLHGDVHDRNVLISTEPLAVRLIDFGFSRMIWPTEAGVAPRGGILEYSEPEYAIEQLERRAPRQLSAAAEQYQVGVLVYRILTGAYYVPMTYDRDNLLTRIRDLEPIAFASHGLRSLPGVEAVLRRCLAKGPENRYPTLRAAKAHFDEASETEIAMAEGVREATLSRRSSALVPDTPVAATLRLAGDLWSETRPIGTKSSVALGFAGLAYAAYRASVRLEEPWYASQAELWVDRASDWSRRSREPGWMSAWGADDGVDDHSLMYGSPGLHLVACMLGYGMGHFGEGASAWSRYATGASSVPDKADLVSGRSGILLGASEAVAELGLDVAARLGTIRFGREALDRLWAHGPEATSTRTFHGMAHGTAGRLQATLLWCRTTGDPLPEPAARELQALTELAVPTRHGVRWPVSNADTSSWPGWCHGTAGHILMQLQARHVTGNEVHLRVALEAGQELLTRGPGRVGHLCCGSGGIAYAFLALYRATGVARWLDAANVATERAVSCVGNGKMLPLSLLKGDLGVAVLATDIRRPTYASMPLVDVAV